MGKRGELTSEQWLLYPGIRCWPFTFADGIINSIKGQRLVWQTSVTSSAAAVHM